MRAAQLDKDNFVINFAEVGGFDAQFVDPLDAVIGSQRNGIAFIHPAPPPPTVPESISPRQFRQALTKFGFRQQVDGAVAASSDQNLKDWYEFTSEFQRHHAEVLTMATALGFTVAQLDQVWIYGATL
jgi:hypothetical protein